MKLVLLSLFFLTISAFAAEPEAEPSGGAVPLPKSQSSEEKDLKSIARQRLYPGGRDEEPLKVQVQLPRVSRKMEPITEGTEPNEPASDD